MKITVVGCGRWGSFIAWYLNKTGHEITSFGIRNDPTFEAFLTNKTNGIVTFGDDISLSCNPSESFYNADAVVISINSQNLRVFLSENGEYIVRTATEKEVQELYDYSIDVFHNLESLG